VTTDDEGRIVVAGYSSNPQQHMTVARLDASGVLDPEFGDGGVVKLDIGVRARSHAVAVQPDGAIVVAGFAVLIPSGIEQFITARLLDDGSPDPDFGNEGWVATAFGQRDARALALALQPDGAIVVAGWARNWSNRDVAVVRYTPTGALDGGFGNGGKATYGVGIGNDEATAVALDGDGRVVIAGYAADGSTYNLMAGRLTSGGQPDPGFNSTGFVRVSASTGVEQANAVLLQADGKVVIAGRSKLNGNQVFALARVTGAGALDATFGTGGITTTAIGELAEVQGIAAVTRGRFVVAGRARLPGGRLQFVTARYQSNGSIDATFGNSGFVLIPLGVKNDEAYAVEAGEDGSILLAGTMRVGNNANFGLARLLVDACGDGFLDAGEECDEGAGPSCCSSTCTVVPAGAVCRAVADACDVEELCDGIASTCGLDEGLPDGDFDGVCDEQDICPLAADPLQKDGDGDGLGDACDPCTSGVVLERPTVRFGGLSTPGGGRHRQDHRYRHAAARNAAGAARPGSARSGARRRRQPVVRRDDPAGHLRLPDRGRLEGERERQGAQVPQPGAGGRPGAQVPHDPRVDLGPLSPEDRRQPARPVAAAAVRRATGDRGGRSDGARPLQRDRLRRTGARVQPERGSVDAGLQVSRLERAAGRRERGEEGHFVPRRDQFAQSTYSSDGESGTPSG